MTGDLPLFVFQLSLQLFHGPIHALRSNAAYLSGTSMLNANDDWIAIERIPANYIEISLLASLGFAQSCTGLEDKCKAVHQLGRVIAQM